MINKRHILFLIPYPLGQAPSQRFRFEQYFEDLKANNFSFECWSFITPRSFHNLYAGGKSFTKITILLIGVLRRMRILLRVSKADFVFIHREVAPIGPPFFEFLIAKVFRKKIIFDFDDAIWLTDLTQESKIERFLRWRSKIGTICQLSYKVSCGNDYLAEFAREHNKRVIHNPTTINTNDLHNPLRNYVLESDKIIIGWTGSHSTIKYLKLVEPILSALEKKYSSLEIHIISDQKPDLHLRSLRFIRWNKETEAADLSKFNIGIMPLPNDEWTMGKCGFKALQYMAMKIPAAVSAVGVNNKIVDHGINGFLISNDDEWFRHLELLITDKSLRIKMGEQGRVKVIENYSTLANGPNFVSLFS